MINAQNIDERRGATSASNALADSLCAARHLAQKGLPRVESDYSQSGDRIHAALATGDFSELTPQERDTAERCLEIEREKLREFFGEHALKAKAYREDPKDPARSRLWMRVRDNQTGKVFEHSCRPDCFYRLLACALVIEYKSLYGDVPESPRNPQLRDQQVIIRGNYIISGDIGVVVIQPGVERNPQICVYSPEDSKRAEEEIVRRVVASNTPGNPATPGEIQCKYCLAKNRCQARIKWAGAMVPAMLNVMDVPMENWTPEQRTRAAAALKPAQDLLDSVKEHIVDGLGKDPNFCPGYYLKPGNVMETIVNPQKCFERFVEAGGTVAQFMPAVKVQKTALRSQLQEVTNAKGKKLDTAMALLTDGITERRQNAPSLKEVEQERLEK